MSVKETLFAVLMLLVFYDFFGYMMDSLWERNPGANDEYEIIMPLDKWVAWKIREGQKHKPIDFSKE